MNPCGQCGVEAKLCRHCHLCSDHCRCGLPQLSLFDADELGLDPETDNTPGAESRNA